MPNTAAPTRSGMLGYTSHALNSPEALIFDVDIEDILVPVEMRDVDDEAVDCLIESIGEIGLQPSGVVSVEWAPSDSIQRAILVTGRHRLEALRRLGWKRIPVAIFDGSPAEAEEWRLRENLCRRELTALQRSEHIARLLQLRAEKVAQVAPVSKGGRGHTGGIRALAIETGLDRRMVQRGLAIAGLSLEAKDEALRLGLADRQGALVEAARSGGTAEQLASLRNAARPPELPEPSPEQVARLQPRREENKQVWRSTMDWSQCAAESLLEWLGPDRSKQLLQMMDKVPFREMAPVLVIDKLRALLVQGGVPPTAAE